MKKFLIFLIMTLTIACAGRQTNVEDANRADQDRLNAPLAHTISFSGENLALIARWYTGDSANWKVIAAENPSIIPNKMRLGDRVIIPARILKTRDPLPKDYVWKGQKAKEVPAVEGVDAANSSSSTAAMEASSSSAPAMITEEVTIPTSSAAVSSEQPSSLAAEVAKPVVEQASSAEATLPAKVDGLKTAPTAEDLNKAKLLDELLE
ncbi:MAG: hypothetical protein IT292_10290 [Deltaproteobacteria bacterium]|nr:hypothetical protein [Deltaproteobacteria bacterium]